MAGLPLMVAAMVMAAPASAAPPHPATTVLSRPAEILAATRRVADWQLAHRDDFSHMPAASAKARNPRDWQQATFWVALTDLADRDRRYAAPILALGRAEGWKLGDCPLHADDQLTAQACGKDAAGLAGGLAGCVAWPSCAQAGWVASRPQTATPASNVTLLIETSPWYRPIGCSTLASLPPVSLPIIVGPPRMSTEKRQSCHTNLREWLISAISGRAKPPHQAGFSCPAAR